MSILNFTMVQRPLFFVFLLLFTSAPVFAQDIIISKVNISGNKRIAENTILNLADIKIGEEYSQGHINGAVQRLNQSGFFDTIDTKVVNGVLSINVKEHPTINRIIFQGNKKLRDKNLEKIIAIKSRETYTASKVEKDAQEIAYAYNVSGRINAIVTPKIIERSDNRVDVVFNILEGRVTEIEKITFTGNRNFTENRLRRVLATKQAGLFRTFTQSDTFIEDRLELDRQNLNDFYINRGYLDFKVLDTTVELTRERNAFFLIFSLEEGQIYHFGKMSVSVENAKIKEENYKKLITIKEGDVYDARRIDSFLKEILINLTKNGHSFMKVTPDIDIDSDKRIVNIDFKIQKNNKIFIERIDIKGNSTTKDSVIREQFDVVEGDPFNQRQIQEAVDRIRALRYFSLVDVQVSEGNAPDKVIIDVNLEEQPTGKLGLGASYSSSSGAVLGIDFEERNFLGRGHTVRADFSNSSSLRKYSISYEDPTFLDRDLHVGIDFGLLTHSLSYMSAQSEVFAFAPKATFPFNENAKLSLNYRYERENLKRDTLSNNTPVDVSPILLNDVGKRTKSALRVGYHFDKTNSKINPTGGFKFDLNTTLSGLGGDARFAKAVAKFRNFSSFRNNAIVLSAEMDVGAIFGSDIRVTDRFFLGGDQLRGFSNYGIGPRDTSNYDTNADGTTSTGDVLGGRYFAVTRLEASFPFGLPEEYGIFGGVFLDVGSVWDLANNNSNGTVIDDGANIRATAGISLFWKTALGPLRFNFSRPIKHEDYDDVENFRFTIDTRF